MKILLLLLTLSIFSCTHQQKRHVYEVYNADTDKYFFAETDTAQEINKTVYVDRNGFITDTITDTKVKIISKFH